MHTGLDEHPRTFKETAPSVVSDHVILPNLTSGVETLGPFHLKTSQPLRLWGSEGLLLRLPTIGSREIDVPTRSPQVANI